MEAKFRTVALWAAIPVVCLAAIGGIFLMTRTSAPTPSGGGTRPGSGSAVTGSGAIPAAVTETAVVPAAFRFERTVGLNEDVTLPVRFRDYSKLPDDFKSMADLEGKLPTVMGKVTLKVKSMTRFATLETSQVADANGEYYGAEFDVTGDAANPVDGNYRPSTLDDRSYDLFPQLVLLRDEQVTYANLGDSHPLARFRSLWRTVDIDLNETKTRPSVVVWKWAEADRPVLAIEYGEGGVKKYVRINY